MKRLIVPALLAIAVVLGISVHGAFAGVIFEDNFNSQPDWWPTSKQVSCEPSSCAAGVPSGWNYWRNDEYWTPYGTSPTPGTNPTIQISSFNSYGGSGKAFTVYNESNNGASGDGWGADGILAKRLSQDYNEIYVQLKIKFQPGFQRFWTVGGNASMIKIFRAYHYDGIGSPFLFFDQGNSAPIYIYDTIVSEWGNRFGTAMRCDPQATQYACTGNTVSDTLYVGSPAWASQLGDGNWHVLSYRLKLNTAIDVKDGIMELWVDNVRQLNKTDMDWIRTGGNINAGWNVIAIGGNAFNNYMHITNTTYQAGAEQWYAIDDVVVSTTPIPSGYVIAGSTTPAAPKNLRIVAP